MRDPTSSILISVVAFGHSVAWWQWIGIFFVFGGLSLSVRAKYAMKRKNAEITAGAGDRDGDRDAGSSPTAISAGEAVTNGDIEKKKDL